MIKNSTSKKLGYIKKLSRFAGLVSFAEGYALSVVGGIWWQDNAGIILVLVIMGVLVGLFNITGREVVPYLVAAIALILVGGSGAFEPLNLVVSGLGDKVNDVVGMMAIFTAPAAVIQAVRAGIVLSKPGD